MRGIWCRAVSVELRRRVDSVPSVVGWSAFAAIIAAAVAVSGFVARSSPERADLSALLVVGGLPATLGAAFAGVIVGVGDSNWRGDRLIIEGGGSARIAFVARGVVCLLVTGTTFGWVVLCALGTWLGTTAPDRAISGGGSARAGVELLVLLLTSSWLGFGFGAATRSRALGLAGMPIILLVGDIALGLGPGWLGMFRFGGVQSLALGEGRVLDGLVGLATWVVIPIAVGYWRAIRQAS